MSDSINITDKYSIEKMCAIQRISRKSFYKWKKNIDLVKKNKTTALML